METVTTGGFNWSLLVAVAALVISVLSPLLTAIINGFFQSKLKRTELRTEQRMKAIRNYLQQAGERTYGQSFGKTAEYLAAKSEIYLFVDPKLWPDIDAFDACANGSSDANEILIRIAKKLSKSYFD